MTRATQRSWQCPACKITGWTSNGRIPPHDRADGRSCRPSGQVSEADIKRRVDTAIKQADIATLHAERKARGWEA
jgi:hypothetical protein